MKVPPTIRYIYHGKPGPWARGKDLILYTIGKIGTDGALYSSMQFEGEAISSLPMEQRLTMCNMVVEAGGKNGLMPFDAVTEAYVKPRAKRQWKMYNPEPGCEYAATHEWDVAGLDSQIAKPFSPGNVSPVSELASKNIAIDQAFVGSCTNGRISDMREAAAVLKGRHVAPWLRCIIIPATMKVYRQCLHEGLIDLFTEAGCVVSTPTCGPCLGGYMGVLAEGERCVSTSNRNFTGRMGHPRSEVYLASASVAAASAVMGRIAHPEELVKPEVVQAAIEGKRTRRN
jgi:3-isopropylmalate/(R)-2-methylmalate dehydratase large subunit